MAPGSPAQSDRHRLDVTMPGELALHTVELPFELPLQPVHPGPKALGKGLDICQRTTIPTASSWIRTGAPWVILKV